MRTFVLLYIVQSFLGCNDPVIHTDQSQSESQADYRQHGGLNKPVDVAFHSYSGPQYGYTPTHPVTNPLDWTYQPHGGHIRVSRTAGFGGSSFYAPRHGSVWLRPHTPVGIPNVNVLQNHAARIHARQIELKQLLSELDREQHYLHHELSTAAHGFQDAQRAIADEYNSLNSLMRSIAPIQYHYPPESVYVNAYSALPHLPLSVPSLPSVPLAINVVTRDTPNVIQPPSLSSQSTTNIPPIVVIPETPTTSPAPPPSSPPVVLPDFGYFISALLQYIDTSLQLVRSSLSGQQLEMELQEIRANVESLRGSTSTNLAESLQAISNRINLLLPRINALPRRTISEVWIDPLRVTSREERNQLDRLVQQETTTKVSVADSGHRDEEINIQSSIPNMFTVAKNAATSHHRLKVLWHARSKQIKLVVICNHREFRKHSDKPRWFFAFTCWERNSSIGALMERGRNDLTQAVLKVVCHSKEFARRLVLDRSQRESRCLISKWSGIANGIPEPPFARFDRRGKYIWKSLIDGRDCFDREESRIHSTCSTKR